MPAISQVPAAVVERIVVEIRDRRKGAYRVANELNAEKIHTPDGRPWTRGRVLTVFANATGIRKLTDVRGKRARIFKRTTVKLPEDLDVRLRLEARQRGVTVSELTREAIEAHLDGGEPRQFLAAASGRSGQGDISERIEELLDEEWRP